MSELPDPTMPPPCPDPDSGTTAALVRWAKAYAAEQVAAERERVNLLIVAIRAHWIKANGFDSMSVAALDAIAEVVSDGSYVDRA